MTSLRTMEGISFNKVAEHFGKEMAANIFTMAQEHINQKHLADVNGYLKTTRKGKLLADGIAADLFQ